MVLRNTSLRLGALDKVLLWLHNVRNLRQPLVKQVREPLALRFMRPLLHREASFVLVNACLVDPRLPMNLIARL